MSWGCVRPILQFAWYGRTNCCTKYNYVVIRRTFNGVIRRTGNGQGGCLSKEAAEHNGTRHKTQSFCFLRRTGSRNPLRHNRDCFVNCLCLLSHAIEADNCRDAASSSYSRQMVALKDLLMTKIGFPFCLFTPFILLTWTTLCHLKPAWFRWRTRPHTRGWAQKGSEGTPPSCFLLLPPPAPRRDDLITTAGEAPLSVSLLRTSFSGPALGKK